MRKFVTLALVGAALSATAAPAFAEAPRWTDAEYLKASRCLGLAEAQELGPVDSTALITQMKAQGLGRDSYLRDRGASMRQDARRLGKTVSEALKTKLLAERDGSCKVYLGTSVAASGAPS